jgi:hypothetical protein
MSDGALLELPAAPFDYEKEPLVTSAVKLNTDNLKKAVQWLVTCVQDQQQTIVRHGQKIDELALGTMSPMGTQKSLKSMQSFAIKEDLTSERSERSISEGSNDMFGKQASVSDGFRNSLSGELLDMKFNAMNRKSLARISSLDGERDRIIADVTAFQRELTGRFQEADKRIHADLANTTDKLFEKLNRISSDVLARIESLENRVNSNADAVTAMRSTPKQGKTLTSSTSASAPAWQGSATVQQAPTSPSGSSVAAKPSPKSGKAHPQIVERELVMPSEASQETQETEPLQQDGPGLLPESTSAAEADAPSRQSQNSFGAPASVDSLSRPGTTGTVGAMSTEEEGSIPSTTDSRKPAWKPAVRRELDPAPVMPEGIGSWEEVQKTLAMIAQVQRQALEEARNDIADISEALQAESSERARVQDDFDALRNTQMTTEGLVVDLKNDCQGLKTECEAMKEFQQDIEGAFNQVDEELQALQMGLDQISMASPSSRREPRESRRGSAKRSIVESRTDEEAAPSQATSRADISQQTSIPSAASPENTAEVQDAPSAKDLVHGAVRRVSIGAKSSGIKEQTPSETRQLAVQEAQAFLTGSEPSQDDPAHWSRGVRNAVPPETEAAEQAVRSQVVAGPAQEDISRLQKRISALEGALPQIENATNARATALEQTIKELKQGSSSLGALPVQSSAPPVKQQDTTGPRFESRLFELEERLQVIEGRPALKIEGRMKPGSTSVDQQYASGAAASGGQGAPLQLVAAAAPSPPEQSTSVTKEVPALVGDAVASCDKVAVELRELVDGAKVDFQRMANEIQQALANSSNFQKVAPEELASLAGDMQGLQSDMKTFDDKTNSISSRLSAVERKAAAAAVKAESLQAAVSARPVTPTATSLPNVDAAAVTSAEGAPRLPLPPLPNLLDAALDKHPADLSHLMDPSNSGGQTPTPFVSKRGLQQAVDGLNDNFRNWLDAIYQSIIAALQNKADSAQVDLIANQVHEAAGRASESVANFAKRSLGGKCASCDAPLTDESIMWKRHAPGGARGHNYIPKTSAGARNAIRPPSSSASLQRGPPVPACGASKLPRLQDLRHSDANEFAKGRGMHNAASEPQLRL